MHENYAALAEGWSAWIALLNCPHLFFFSRATSPSYYDTLPNSLPTTQANTPINYEPYYPAWAPRKYDSRYEDRVGGPFAKS